MNSKLSDFNKRLIRQFLTFDGEMIKIGAKWREVESSIIKYQYVAARLQSNISIELFSNRDVFAFFQPRKFNVRR